MVHTRTRMLVSNGDVLAVALTSEWNGDLRNFHHSVYMLFYTLQSVVFFLCIFVVVW